VVLAFDELHSTMLVLPERGPACPDCFAELRREPTPEVSDDALRHRCTRCGSAWERNRAGWLFPLRAA
jgi:hypothetical protein